MNYLNAGFASIFFALAIWHKDEKRYWLMTAMIVACVFYTAVSVLESFGKMP